MSNYPAPEFPDPTLSHRNLFLSFVQPLYEQFDRARLYPVPGDPLANYIVQYGDDDEEKDRKAVEDCTAFVVPEPMSFAGGRGRKPSAFNVMIGVKRDADIYHRVSMPLLDEVIRIYELPIMHYDFTSGSRVELNQHVVCALSETRKLGVAENSQLLIWSMLFDVFACRHATFDTAD